MPRKIFSLYYLDLDKQEDGEKGMNDFMRNKSDLFI